MALGAVDRVMKWVLTTWPGLLCVKGPVVALLLCARFVQSMVLRLLRPGGPAVASTGEHHVRPGVVRTPEARFAGINFHEDYPPQYFEHAGYRVAYVDTGFGGTRKLRAGSPGAAGAAFAGRPPPTLLLLHGEPDWSYLYHDMLPVFDAAGYRCVTFDFIGFGRSDKPTDEAAYSAELHTGTLQALLERLDLHNVVMVGQDWGGMHGLALLPLVQARVSRLVIMNTGLLPMGARGALRLSSFVMWRALTQLLGRALPVGLVMALFAVPFMHLTPRQRAAYDAPFPCRAAKAGVVAWPTLVPLHLPGPLRLLSDALFDHSRMPHAAHAAGLAYLGSWDRPTFLCYSQGDPIFHGDEPAMVAHMPALAGVGEALAEARLDARAVGAEPVARGRGRIVTIPEAGHFLQMDAGGLVARRILEFMEDGQ